MSKIDMLHIGSVAISVVALQEFVLKRPGSDPKRYVATIGRWRVITDALECQERGLVPCDCFTL